MAPVPPVFVQMLQLQRPTRAMPWPIRPVAPAPGS